MATDPLSNLREAVESAVAAIGETSQEPTLERPKRAGQGDYATNAAILLAPALGQAPVEIAARLAAELERALAADAERVEIAGPGFVNVFLSDSWHRGGVREILAAERFGAGPSTPPAALVEFVSANPTGPLTAAGGRGAAYGDSLSRILEMSGHDVTREYYLNDAGTQIRAFAASIAARMEGREPPEDGYSGAYIAELAAELEASGVSPDDQDGLARAGAESMRAKIEATLERFSVRFDNWSSERALQDKGALEETHGPATSRPPYVRIGRSPLAEDLGMGR